MGLQLTGGEQGRNELCKCNSGLKFKHCHGDITKQMICTQVANEVMAKLVFQERINKGIICKHGILKGEHCGDCKMEN